MNQKNRLIILAGPTAVGKSALSIALAEKIGGEIISADSMQIYKYMDIGSAKITRQEMAGIPHHLIDVLSPFEEFNVFRFQQMAKEALRGIYQRGHIPIVVGGTGFYIQALLYDIDFSSEETGGELRTRLESLAREKGSPYLHAQLEKVDPQSARDIHPNNAKRIIRALEYYEQNGEPISGHNRREREKQAAYDSRYFVLTDARERLYEGIHRRVDQMMEDGLLEEVRRLRKMGCERELVSMQGLGYKELLSYLGGERTLEQAVADIKQNTRHFAKRQLTWFRRERDVIWVNKEELHYNKEEILNFMLERCRQDDSGKGQEAANK